MNTAKFDKEFVAAPLPPDCAPEEICEQCAAGAFFHHVTKVCAVYCQHNQCGAALPPGGNWHVAENITLLEFKEQLLNELVVKEVLDRRKANAN